VLQQHIQVLRIGPGDSASVSFSRCEVSILVQNNVEYKDWGFTWFLSVCLFNSGAVPAISRRRLPSTSVPSRYLPVHSHSMLQVFLVP